MPGSWVGGFQVPIGLGPLLRGAEGLRVLGQHRRRQFARMLGDEEAHALGRRNEGGSDHQAFIGAGAQQRAVIAEPVDGDRELFEMAEIGFPAAFRIPGVRAIGCGEIPEQLDRHEWTVLFCAVCLMNRERLLQQHSCHPPCADAGCARHRRK